MQDYTGKLMVGLPYELACKSDLVDIAYDDDCEYDHVKDTLEYFNIGYAKPYHDSNVDEWVIGIGVDNFSVTPKGKVPEEVIQACDKFYEVFGLQPLVLNY